MSADLEKSVNAVLAQHNHIRANGKTASERTQTLTKEVVYTAFRRLHALGMNIENPVNLKPRHIEALVRDWWYVQKKKPKTIQNDLSRLRRFATMMGKAGLVRSVNEYLPDVDPEALQVKNVAEKSKSWDAAGLDMVEIFRKVDEADKRLGLMLRMELAFGLRREEALKCKPHEQDGGTCLHILAGQGKGGRPRMILIKSQYQREILDYVKKHVPKTESLGWPYTVRGKTASLKQNLTRYRNMMQQLGFTKKNMGVTGHGLRAQFAENNALMHDIVPPSLGGEKNQKEKEDMQVQLGKLSEDMGHHRLCVMSSYYGSFKNSKNSTDSITSIIDRIPAWTGDIPEERRTDCIHIRNTLEEQKIDLSLKQIYTLWKSWSTRCGMEWVKPDSGIATAIMTIAKTYSENEEVEVLVEEQQQTGKPKKRAKRKSSSKTDKRTTDKHGRKDKKDR